VEKIGAGGMGEVYRAVDTRLDRTVAIKILPSHFSGNPELKQRFEREAHVISNLSHPHICTLYDVGHEEGIDFLVMEYLEGETLAERLGKGALSPHEVLRYGAEIAEALDRAHRSGVVHRDLKPGNVMLTKDGVKLLDFGLAKACVDESASCLTSAGPTEGVTKLASQPEAEKPLTEKGTTLGTFRYMAPEQLEGREVDSRTDIFALGAVLYEMATGSKAFTGESQASLIAAIMERDPPPLTAVEPMTPPALDRTVRQCLSKDQEDRWQNAKDVASELRWIAEESSQTSALGVVAGRRRRRGQLAWGLAAVSFITLVIVTAMLLIRQGPEPVPVRFRIHPPEGLTSIDSPRISPDGRVLAFNATDTTGITMIWLRPLDALDASPLPGTEGAERPFWSPDSRFLGFFTNGRLKKISISGGPAQVLGEAATGADGAWGRDGVILYDGTGTEPLWRFPPKESSPQPASTVNTSRGEIGHAWPEFLPDGKRFLYVAYRKGSKEAVIKEVVMADLSSHDNQPLIPSDSRVEYAPPGYLLFVRDRTLMAQPLDHGTLALAGEPYPVAEGFECTFYGLAYFSVSQNDILVYRPNVSTTTRFVWVDRQGKTSEEVASGPDFISPDVSPDGQRVAISGSAEAGDRPDIWLLGPSRGAKTRFTFDPAMDLCPVWSPDGTRIAFMSARGEETAFGIYEKPSSGSGPTVPLFESENISIPTDWSKDGKYIIYTRLHPETGSDLCFLPTSGDRTPVTFLETQTNEGGGVLSPDGRWLAYTSDESGTSEVYVQSFPEGAGRWQLSSAGGSEPRWRDDGSEILYVSADQTLMAVEVETGTTVSIGASKPLFRLRSIRTIRNQYDVSGDGERILLVQPSETQALQPFTVVLNWTAGLQSPGT
jgi:serine/threonine protein kinase